MTNKSDVESLVRKFVANHASEEEIELLQEYFKTPMGLKYLEKIIDEHAVDFDKSHLVQSDSKPYEPVAVKEEVKNESLRFSRNWTRGIAATFIGIAMVAAAYLYLSPMYSVTVYKTLAGQKTTITLPDSTIVTLNGNSSLSYRGSWKETKLRSVDFSGEAYFKVKSNAEKPFVVNTSGITIKVVGTTFNVKSYDEDEDVETTLVEGKVIIEKAAEGHSVSEIVKLLPDQKAIFSKNSKQIVLKKVKSENEASWIKGSLIFEDEPFSEIVKDLERWYGAKIILKDRASLQCRFNTKIESESLEEVLKLFSLSGNVKYHFKDDHQVLIEGSLCGERAN